MAGELGTKGRRRRKEEKKITPSSFHTIALRVGRPPHVHARVPEGLRHGLSPKGRRGVRAARREPTADVFLSFYHPLGRRRLQRTTWTGLGGGVCGGVPALSKPHAASSEEASESTLPLRGVLSYGFHAVVVRITCGGMAEVRWVFTGASSTGSGEKRKGGGVDNGG